MLPRWCDQTSLLYTCMSLYTMIHLPPYSCSLPTENSNTRTLLEANMSQIWSCGLPWHVPTLYGTNYGFILPPGLPWPPVAHRQESTKRWHHIVWYTYFMKWNSPVLYTYYQIVSCPFFTDAHIIFAHTTSQYYVQSKAKRDISMQSGNLFPYMLKQTRDNECIPYRHDMYPFSNVPIAFNTNLL